MTKTARTVAKPQTDHAIIGVANAQEGPTFRSVIPMFLASREAKEPPVQPTTLDRYRRDLEGYAGWLEREGHPAAITDIQGKDGGTLIGAYMAELRRKGRKDTARRSIFTSLAAFWNWAEWESAGNKGEPGVNPPYVFMAATKGVTPPPDQPADHVGKVYSAQEVERIIEACGARKSSRLWERRNRMIVRVLWETGIRRQELARLKVADYLSDGAIELRRSTTKTKRARTVYLYNGAKVEADSYIMILKHEGHGDDDAPLFPSERAHLDPDTDRPTHQLRADGVGDLLNRIIRTVQDGCPNAAKHPKGEGCSQCVRYSGCHRFRHSWKARATATGMSQDSQKELGGWSTDRAMARYGTGDRPRQAQAEAKRMADNGQ